MKKLLPILAASVMMLAACGGGGAKKELKSLTISNKEELTAQWVVGQDDREVEIECSEIVVVDEMGPGGHLKLTSSDTSIFTVMGSMIHAVAEGEATLSAVYKNYTYDTVTITVTGALPEPAHFTGTIAEAVADLNQDNVGSKLYDLQGYVVAWQSGKSGPGEYGNYYLADSIDETDLSKCAYVYGSSPENVLPAWNGAKYETMSTVKGFDKNDMTKEVAIGSKITLTAVGAYYNTTQEFLGKTTAVDNSEVVVIHEYTATIAEATAVINGLADNQTTIDLYEVTGEIKLINTAWSDQYENITVTISDGTNDLQVFRGKLAAGVEFAGTDIAVGGTITVKGNLCKYVKNDAVTPELTAGVISAYTPGTGPVPVPEEHQVTIAEALAVIADLEAGVDSFDLYEITGEVKSIDTAWSTQYENITVTLTDGTNDIKVFRAKLADGVAFAGTDIAVGGTLTVKGNLQKYVKNDVTTPELTNGKMSAFSAGEVPPGPGPEEGDVANINTAIGQWTVTGDGTASEKATLTSDGFTLTYEIGSATTYISSYSSTATNAIRVYAHSNFKIEWDATVASVESVTFTTTGNKNFATNYAFVGGAIDASYTAVGTTCKVNVTGTYLAIQDASAQVRVESIKINYTAAV